MGTRPLTLDSVPDSLLAEYGFRPGAATRTSYLCIDPQAILVPVDSVIPPTGRKLNEDALRNILREIRDDIPIYPVQVIMDDPSVVRFSLHHGMHRWSVSKALGFPEIPCHKFLLDEC